MENSWNQVTRTVAAEFADVNDLEQITRVVLRLGLAALLGGLLGWEREIHGKSAGLRTHMLVAMGAALFVLIALESGGGAADISRVLQGVIAGVGFLGAGTILKGDAHGDTLSQVKGLTTAAGIWLTAAMGAAAGAGKEVTAVLCAGLAFGTMALVPLFAPTPHLKSGADGAPSPAPPTPPPADRA